MKRYFIKNNLPTETDGYRLETSEDKEYIIDLFFEISDILAKKYNTKIFFRNIDEKPLRGQIQVEIDYFYFYVELYVKED